MRKIPITIAVIPSKQFQSLNLPTWFGLKLKTDTIYPNDFPRPYVLETTDVNFNERFSITILFLKYKYLKRSVFFLNIKGILLLIDSNDNTVTQFVDSIITYHKNSNRNLESVNWCICWMNSKESNESKINAITNRKIKVSSFIEPSNSIEMQNKVIYWIKNEILN
ncbi:MAG: hypothetical protein ACXAC7_18370 [Candidatus Hodarchaeales archaeon]|jgi:hypothetical protein